MSFSRTPDNAKKIRLDSGSPDPVKFSPFLSKIVDGRKIITISSSSSSASSEDGANPKVWVNLSTLLESGDLSFPEDGIAAKIIVGMERDKFVEENEVFEVNKFEKK